MNAPVMVELEGETDPLKIAMKELKLVENLCIHCIKIKYLLLYKLVMTCHDHRG